MSSFEQRLDKQKKLNYYPEVRKVCIEKMDAELNRLISNVRDENVKETLLKLSVKVSYDKNSKALGTCDVKVLNDNLNDLK